MLEVIDVEIKDLEEFIELSKDKVKRSTVIGDSKKNDISEVRTSTNAFLKNSLHPLMNEIDKRIYNIIGKHNRNYKSYLLLVYK